MRVYRKVRYVELHTQQARYDTYMCVKFHILRDIKRKRKHWNSGMDITLDGAGYSKLTLRS